MRIPSMTTAALLFGYLAAVAAQSPAQLLREFEVASVRPSATDSVKSMMPVVAAQPGGRYSVTNASLKKLVQVAYGVEDFQVDGGPPWAASERFDIQAKAPMESPTTDELNAMLRGLLASRFALKLHTETRSTTTFALRLVNPGTAGAGLKPSQIDCNAPRPQAAAGPVGQTPSAPPRGRGPVLLGCGAVPVTSTGKMGVRAVGQPIDTLARMLSQVTGRTVSNKTGLTGLYDYEVEFDLTEFLGRAGPGVAQPSETQQQSFADSPALNSALREQLGLSLVRETSPVSFIVIDTAQKPTSD